MFKRLMGIAVLGVLVGGAMATAAQKSQARAADAEVEAVIDARLHELLVQLNARR